jgi:hypothetical protein
MVHTWKETGEVRAPSRRLHNALTRALALAKPDRLELWPEGGNHETSLALWVGGDLRVEDNSDHSHDGEPGWITGTSDFWWKMVDGVLWVDDLKTGKYYPNPPPGDRRNDPELAEGANRFPQRAATPQTLFYALATSLWVGYDGPVMLSVTHWPRLPIEYRHREPFRLWDSASRTQLAKYGRELQDLERQRLNPTLNPGAHCRFCPSRPNCLIAEEF